MPNLSRGIAIAKSKLVSRDNAVGRSPGAEDDPRNEAVGKSADPRADRLGLRRNRPPLSVRGLSPQNGCRSSQWARGRGFRFDAHRR
jgi:hypothetical protein